MVKWDEYFYKQHQKIGVTKGPVISGAHCVREVVHRGQASEKYTRCDPATNILKPFAPGTQPGKNINPGEGPPPKVQGWIGCQLGQSPHNDNGLACRPFNTDIRKTCGTAYSCFAITDIELQWGPEVTGCDGFGHTLTIVKCMGWINGQAHYCRDRPYPKKPVIGWISCSAGSSPGGTVGFYPNDRAGGCSHIHVNDGNFPCIVGQNCFAILADEENQGECCSIAGSIGSAIDPHNKATPSNCIKWVGEEGMKLIGYIVGAVVSFLVLIIIIRLILKYRNHINSRHKHHHKYNRRF